MHDQDKKRLLIACAVFISLTLIVLYITFILVMRTNPDQTTTTTVTINGEIACLPKKASSQDSTLECAIGLYGDDNRYYALINLPQADTWHTGDRVNISGKLTSGSYQNFETAGAIAVTKADR